MNVKHFTSIGGLLFFCVVGACHARSVGASGQATSANEKRLYTRFVSEKGRFSIDFIREPTYDVQEFGPTVIHEFRVSDGKTEWRLTYTDFQNEVNDEDSVRAAYQKGIESLQMSATLITQTDIRLKGRLGAEYLMRKGEVVYTTRSFLIGRRLYLLSVEENRGSKRPAAKAAISPKVRRFLDSFDFWEINNLQLSAN